MSSVVICSFVYFECEEQFPVGRCGMNEAWICWNELENILYFYMYVLLVWAFAFINCLIILAKCQRKWFCDEVVFYVPVWMCCSLVCVKFVLFFKCLTVKSIIIHLYISTRWYNAFLKSKLGCIWFVFRDVDNRTCAFLVCVTDKHAAPNFIVHFKNKSNL